MLQLLSLIAMEVPSELLGDAICDERAKVLKEAEFVSGFLGQYNGYKDEKGVQPNSTTETFSSLLLKVNNPR